jgi:predicted lactoylglutathione lyase
MPRILDHIDLRVPDLEAAGPFYRTLLPALGFTKEMRLSGWIQFIAPPRDHDDITEFFGLTEDKGHVPNRNRIAFWAASMDEVDRLATRLREIGAKNIEGPGYDEGPFYYAVFFEDPWGNRLEVCHRTVN